ncbi:hypothetical protein CYMTET_56424 [Cymbomonas tetramitiformis]|uniref:Uncharacterized protein n=1 Tax=Cymbomonas tetramitiformis TaxID=36881 RepID=A0AAE0BBB1_9CHLO|nr:hypothetical protein CYMTET_56424 [Cymbomonas tetramitiformis]
MMNGATYSEVVLQMRCVQRSFVGHDDVPPLEDAVASSTGTIPGSGGDIPGMPDAWCSLYRVHQYRERRAALTPAEARQDLFGERHESREATELGVDVPVATMEDGPLVRDSSPGVDGIDLTQQMARADDPQQDMGSDKDQPEEELSSHPLVGDDGSEDEGDEDSEAAVGRCKRILCGGGVLWTAHLAAAHDEDGALLLVFYAYLRGKRVKVLVDSGASENFVSEECARRCGLRVQNGSRMKVTLADRSVKTTGVVAYSKFTAPTAAGSAYNESAMAMPTEAPLVRGDKEACG